MHSGRGQELCFWDASQVGYDWFVDAKSTVGSRLLRLPINVLFACYAVYLMVRALLENWLAAAGAGGRKLQRPTVVVNAALMYRNTGKLGNEPQVVVI